MTENAPRIVAIANQKGGVGKTTTAVNLSAALAMSNVPTLLLDLDPQGNASTGLGSYSHERDLTTYELLTGEAKLSEIVVKTSVDHLKLAPGSTDLSGVDAELLAEADRAQRLKRAATGADARVFDYIVLDCPPSLNLLTINALAAADRIIIPLQAEYFALEGLSQLLATIKQIQTAVNPTLKISGILLTMYDQRNRLSRQVAEDVRANLGEDVYRTMVPRNVRLSEAPSHGMPVFQYDPECAGSRAYLNFALEFLERDGYGKG